MRSIFRKTLFFLCGPKCLSFPRAPHSLVLAELTRQKFKKPLDLEDTLRFWYLKSSLQVKEWEKKPVLS